MQTNTSAEVSAKNTANISQDVAVKKRSHWPFTLLVAMIAATLFLDAVLPLGGLWFHTALLPQLGSQSLLPAHVLFPNWAVSSIITSDHPQPPTVLLSWQQVPFLLMAFLLLFLLYFVALRRLPQYLTTCRYIFYSTLLLGSIYALIPVVTSPDLFSYMSYARMAVLYHLNPLTTLPTAISGDPTFVHIYWTTQPSAYGPTWAAIGSLLQLLVLPFGAQSLIPMLMALRLFGLAAHLCSTLLIWSTIGHIQRHQGQINHQKRILATLAFAWNPLLLLEACVNAHNDAVLLLFILLAIWFLASRAQLTTRSYIIAVILFALATCLKLNAGLLIPFILIFIWKQVSSLQNAAFQHRDRPYAYRGRLSPPLSSIAGVGLVPTLVAILIYAGIIVLLYAPFWQHGALLNVLHTNPTTYRNINTPMEFLFHFYNALTTKLGFPRPPIDGSPAENLTHTLSIAIFVVLYAWLCWRAIRTQQTLRTLPSLVRWLALVWFLYCAVGTPWFWPWYLVTFFGLYALVEATSSENITLLGFTITPLTLALFAFSMLSIYCFYAWGVYDSFVRGLPDFRWADLRGLWAWGIPLLAIRRQQRPTIEPGDRISTAVIADQK